MLKRIVVLLALVYLSQAEDTIKEILFHLRELREQHHLLIFVLESSYYPGARIHWNLIHCKMVVAYELLKALDHVKITSSPSTHRLWDTVRKLQINIDGLLEGERSKSTIAAEDDCTKDKIMFIKTYSMADSVFIDHYISFFQDWQANAS